MENNAMQTITPHYHTNYLAVLLLVFFGSPFFFRQAFGKS